MRILEGKLVVSVRSRMPPSQRLRFEAEAEAGWGTLMLDGKGMFLMGGFWDYN
jgi:hypothetical protein